jgi:hypothetical protein
MLLDGRKDVENASPDGELATALNNVGADIAAFDELFDRLRNVDLVTDVQPNRLDVTEPNSKGLKQSSDWRNKHRQPASAGVITVGMRKAAEHRDTLPHGVRARRQPLVGQRLPRREPSNGCRVEHRPQSGDQIVGLTRGRCDGKDRS